MIEESPAEVVAAWFVYNGLAVRPNQSGAWPISTSSMPDDPPDDRLTAYNPSAMVDGVDHSTGETFLRPEVQIRVRSKSGQTGMNKLLQLLNAITLVKGETIISDKGVKVTIVSVRLVSGPAHMGQEEKNQRQHHVANVSLVLVPGV